MAGCGCEIESSHHEERKVLWWLLAINAVMFVVELMLGWVAESTGLIADALDMLADASVYGVAIYAVTRTRREKAYAALLSGMTEVILALGVLLEVGRRFVMGSEPVSELMMSVSLLALLANVACLLLLSKHRDGEVHMRASWIFSANDVLANVGVILAGALVYFTGSSLPDLLIGLLIVVLVMRGGIMILRDARASLSTCDEAASASKM